MMYQNGSALQFLHGTEKMLKSLSSHNNASPFSMESLLAREKLSPDNLEKSEEQELRRMSGPESDGEAESGPQTVQQAAATATDVLLKLNSCFKSRICSGCGRLDCGYLQCRVQSDAHGYAKDSKPVLKFSVSAILGTEHHQHPVRTVANGKDCLRFIESIFAKVLH